MSKDTEEALEQHVKNLAQQELKDVVNRHSAALREVNKVLKDYRDRLEIQENEVRKLHNMIKDLQTGHKIGTDHSIFDSIFGKPGK